MGGVELSALVRGERTGGRLGVELGEGRGRRDDALPGRVDLGGGRAAVVLAELFEVRVEVRPGRGQRFGRAVDLAIDHHALDRGEGVAHVFDGRLVGIGDARGHRGRSELFATHLQPGRLDLQRLEASERRRVDLLGVADRLPGGFQLAPQRALVHARARELGQLAVCLLDGGGRGRTLLEDPLEGLLDRPLLCTAGVEGLPSRLDRREVLRQPVVELLGPLGPLAQGADAAVQVLELVPGGVAVVHGAGHGRIELGTDRVALRGPLLREPVRRQPQVLRPQQGRVARRPDRAQIPCQQLGQPSAIRRVCQGDGQSPVEAAGSGVVGRLVRHVCRSRRIDPTTPLAPWQAVPSDGSYRPKMTGP